MVKRNRRFLNREQVQMTPAVVKIIIQFLFFDLKRNKGVDYENDYTITWPNGTESQG